MVAAYYCVLMALTYAKNAPYIKFDFMKFGKDGYTLYTEFKKRLLEHESNSNNNNST